MSEERVDALGSPHGVLGGRDVEGRGANVVGPLLDQFGRPVDPLGKMLRLDGVPLDLTILSFGILRAIDLPTIDVEIADHDGDPVNGSDAVFAAVAAAAWRHLGFPPDWPARPA